MIKNKFLCYRTVESFKKELSSIDDNSIVFVLDEGFLYTHKTVIFDPKIREVIYNALGYLEDRISDNEETLSVALNSFEEKLKKEINSFSDAEKTKLSGIEAGAQKNTVLSVAGKTGGVTLVKGDVGLGNVDNTSDLAKPISSATQTALNGKVDKVTGKGLSTNDYTSAEKYKLESIGEGANVRSVNGQTGDVTISGGDEEVNDISSKALGSLESRIDMLEGTMGIALNELQLEIQKLRNDKEL